MTDPAIIKAAARALRNRAAEIHVQSQGEKDPDVMFFADVFAEDVIAAVTPLIEAAALERASGQWHPAATLPDQDGPYLVFSPSRTLDQFSVQHFDRIEGSFSNDFGITHWQPLPAPPKEHP